MNNILSFKAKIGWVSVIENNKKILSVSFGKLKNSGNSNILKEFKKNLKEYFSGKRKNFKNKILFSGSKIQIKIWKELKKIPYGKTKSYGQIAKKLNTSPRFVGNVCGLNKHLIVVPCHRVIRSDGTLGGFSGLGGIKLKKRLLELENDE